MKKRKSQLESIQEQLQNQLDEPVLTWIHEEDTGQRMKTDPELSQDHGSETVYQKENCDTIVKSENNSCFPVQLLNLRCTNSGSSAIFFKF